MKKIYANNLTTLSLGRQGENLARQVVFDIRDLESLYGSGTVEVIYQRPGDAQPYPLAVQRDGTLVTWDVTATDTEMSAATANERYGKCELRYYAGETLAKSQIWRTWVESAMDTPSETTPPEPEQGWVDQVLAAGAAAMTAADGAKADADRAAALAEEVAEKAAQTAQDASDAAKAMEAAQTAQRLAEEAQRAAKAARTAAAAAQAAAETAATDAAGAKQDAETALKSAQDAAAAAANALKSIQTLYQEMQTWAQGVIQDVYAAGSIAVQSVQSAGDAQVQRVTDEGTTQTANAKAQADAAAQSASGAAQSAQEAAESAAVYDDVVADLAQLKQDVAANTPDDTTVDGKPWTSKKIVDSLCQPIEESGNPVQVYPVENYPLGVKVSWEPAQEGSGDPSPDNIRPITGRDAVSVTRCGENLFNKYGLVVGAPVYGADGVISSYQDVAVAYVKVTPGAQYSIRFRQTDDTTLYTRIAFLTKSMKFIKRAYMLYSTLGEYVEQTFTVTTDCEWIQFGMNNGRTFNYNFDVVFVAGGAPTTDEPYTGDTYDIALPETVYGGTLDVETGVLTITHGQIASYAGESLPGRWMSDRDVYTDGAIPTVGAQVVYELAEPYTIQLTPKQITALSGVNTIYTNADGVVVTGAEDPKHTITELKNAIISLGGNI